MRSTLGAVFTLFTLLMSCTTLLIVLVMPASVAAQPPTSYILKISNIGASTPFSTTTLPASGFVCGVTPKLASPSGTFANPKRVVIDDPAAPTTADCVFTDAGAGPLLALPFGTQQYNAVIDVVNSAGTSADSLVSNSFSRPGTVAPAPTGLRVTQ